MTPLSEHFTLEELTRSDVATRRAIDNTPDAQTQARLCILAQGLERVRALLAVPMHIDSGYRCPTLNAAIGGARDSRHMVGLAADFVAPDFGAPKAIAEFLADRADDLRFDQLIQEGDWVHIAFADDTPPRGDILTAHFVGGTVRYTKGLA